MIKTCSQCELNLDERFFIKDQTACFRCVYREKIKTEKSRRHKCRECDKVFFCKKELKKKQRTVYCSEICAESGYKKQRNSHWTKKLKRKIPLSLQGLT